MEIYDSEKGNFDTADTIIYRKLGPGKFTDTVDEFLWEIVLNGAGDEDIGNEYFGLYTLIVLDTPVTVKETDYYDTISLSLPEWVLKAAIVHETDQGFVETSVYKTESEAMNDWEQLEVEYSEFLDEQEEDED